MILKNFFNTFFLFTLLSFIAPIFALNPLCPRPIKVGWEPYAPFQMGNMKAPLEVDGIDIELIEVVLKKVGCDIDFELSPRRRQITNLERGQIDIVTSMKKMHGREKFALFSHPYRKDGNVMYALKSETHKYKFKELKDIINKHKFESVKDYEEFKLGITRGYEYGKAYTEITKKPEFHGNLLESITTQNLIDKAENNNISAFIANITVISYLLKKQDKSNLFSVFPVKVEGGRFIYFAYSKKSVSPELANQIDAALKTILKDGTFNTILLKYIPQDIANIVSIK